MTRGIRQVVGVLGVLVLCAHVGVGHAHDDSGSPQVPVQNHEANCPIHNGFVEVAGLQDFSAPTAPVPERIVPDAGDPLPRPTPALPSRPRAPPSF